MTPRVQRMGTTLVVTEHLIKDSRMGDALAAFRRVRRHAVALLNHTAAGRPWGIRRIRIREDAVGTVMYVMTIDAVVLGL